MSLYFFLGGATLSLGGGQLGLVLYRMAVGRLRGTDLAVALLQGIAILGLGAAMIIRHRTGVNFSVYGLPFVILLLAGLLVDARRRRRSGDHRR